MQGAEIKRQWRPFADVFHLDGANTGRSVLAQAQCSLPGGRFIKAAALIVADRSRRLPAGFETNTVCHQLGVDVPEGVRHKARDGPVAFDYQAQRRGLDAANRQHTIKAGAAAEQGEQPA